MPPISDRKKFIFTAALAALLVLFCVGVWKIYDRYREHAPAGLALNKRAWIASYEERGLPVPPDGPREGYWGARLGTKHPSAQLGWFEREIHIPNLVDVDSSGLQRISSSSVPVADILIVGGSVAYGAYASGIDKTYFAQLADILAQRGLPVRVTVFAAGAWTSANELTAFRLYLARQKPDVAVFLDGLNDLTRLKDFPPERRVADYLRRIRRAGELAKSKNVPLVVACQPFYPDKKIMSPLEKSIKKNSYDPELLMKYFPQMKSGIKDMAQEGILISVDCSDALNNETKTTFSDQWHFSDPGHRLLAAKLAEGLEPVVRQVGASRSSFRHASSRIP